MTRPVHSFRNLSSALPGHTAKVERYACQGCGRSYQGQVEALNCELHHQALLKATACGEPLVPPKRDATTDHAAATSELLRRIVKRLENGVSPEDLGAEVELIGRMMARRT